MLLIRLTANYYSSYVLVCCCTGNSGCIGSNCDNWVGCCNDLGLGSAGADLNNHVGEERSEIWDILLTVGAPDGLVTEKEVFERGENHAVDVNVEEVDDVVEGRIEGAVGFFGVKLDDDDSDIVDQYEEMEV